MRAPLARRRAGGGMSDFDRLPAPLRRWLHQAVSALVACVGSPRLAMCPAGGGCCEETARGRHEPGRACASGARGSQSRKSSLIEVLERVWASTFFTITAQ